MCYSLPPSLLLFCFYFLLMKVCLITLPPLTASPSQTSRVSVLQLDSSSLNVTQEACELFVKREFEMMVLPHWSTISVDVCVCGYSALWVGNRCCNEWYTPLLLVFDSVETWQVSVIMVSIFFLCFGMYQKVECAATTTFDCWFPFFSKMLS